jgi:hypothetical protein
MTDTASRLRCAGCGREVDYCAFCDEEACATCVCYRCVLFELGEARPVLPHDDEHTEA